MKELLLIDEATVASLLTLEEAFDAVTQGFLAHTRAEGRLFPVVKEKYSDTASFSLKSGVMTSPSVVGVKAAGSWRANPARGLPTVQATIVLVDPETGEPLAIIAGKTLTTLRTGAAGGVAAKLLAPNDAKTVGVIGTGVQGQIQTEAVLAARPGVTTLQYCDPTGGASQSFVERFSGRCSLIASPSPSHAAAGADIVITATPSATPLINFSDIKPGAHVNAVGTDSKGKREIGQQLLEYATRVVDSAEQARAIGEHQYAPDLPVMEIGALLDKSPIYARASNEITLFDSTGVAFQDLAAAHKVYTLACAKGLGTRIAWPT